jgi:hypothetical protein
MPRPDINRIPSFYHNYVNLVKHNDLQDALSEHITELNSILSTVKPEKWDYKYAEEKWSVKELVQHIIDTERIFNYRALCFARGDRNELPGFDENLYAANSNAAKRSTEDLINELLVVQKSTKFLFESFTEEQLQLVGIANKNPISVLAIGFITVGHAKHHVNILNERYL